MNIILRAAVAALIASLVCQLIKKHNPEYSFVVGAAVSVLILLASSPGINALEELINCSQNIVGKSSATIKPLLKCMGIGLIGKFSADLCRDASQSAAAASVELCATLCAASAAMPIIITMLKMIGTMV